MKRIGVLTSGGDSSGMNAAIRAIVRTAISHGVETYGIRHGFAGLIRGECALLTSRDVGGVINRGGTFLRTSRCNEFLLPEGRAMAHASLVKYGIEGLIVIGGDGTLRGAQCLFDEFGTAINGVPGTIDNDVPGTDYSIGFDTAINAAIDAIDRVRDTAYSHDRIFVIEVMGRHHGYIAAEAGLAAGAEITLVPEHPYTLDDVCTALQKAQDMGRLSCIVVVAEGAASAAVLKEQIKERMGLEVRYLVLGHMQRGGIPTAFDRALASRLGSFATERLLAGHSGELAGLQNNMPVATPIKEVLEMECKLDLEKLRLMEMMAQ
ncbi:MAG: 6-phosphofructokinase [Armatimonadetes bacterium]|nr:6-phosphofructokinase [Armatimonadota bacterium]